MAALISNNSFLPTIGNCYEVHFGKITLNGQTGFCVANIKIEGNGTSQWIDLDTGQSLDPNIAKHVVQAYKDIQCP